MLIILLSLFATVILFSFLPFNNKIDKFLLFIVLGCVIIFIAAIRGENVDKDYVSYKELFFLEGFDSYVEVSFLFIKFLVKYFLFNKFLFLILIYAVLGVSLKFFAIFEMSEFWFFSILVYLANIYIIQDLTQIRAGVCSAILLVSLIPLRQEKNYWFFMLALLAVLFHYSGLILIFIWFLDVNKINKKFWMLIIPFSYLAYFSHLNLTNFARLIPVESVQAKLNFYFLIQDSVEELKVNVFNILILFRVIIIYIFFYKLDFFISKSSYFIILLKIYIISIAVLVITSDVSTISFRLNELLSISEIILVPFLIYLFKPSYIGKIAVVLFSIILFYVHLRAETLLIF